MQGTILSHDINSQSGVIAASDGNRYSFASSDIADRPDLVRNGATVDFVATDGMASAIYPIVSPSSIDLGGKNKFIAALLAFFLGGLGVHKFYLGKTTAGIIMLVASLLGIVLVGIPTLIIAIIAFVEMVIYLVKSEQDFHRDYVIGDRAWF